MSSSTLFILIDGLRPDALNQTECPALHSLIARGSSTLTAQSVMPSMTLPCHMSIFHSVPPTRHGVTTNTWQPMARPLPGLVDVAAQANRHCAFFYNWEQLRELSQPGSLAYSYFRYNVYSDPAGDRVIADAAADYIAHERPDFAFVYLGTVDTFGHLYGWMSEEYLQQVTKVDSYLGRLLQVVPAETTIVLQSDHGGHDRNHGTDNPEDMTIPWIVAGPGIRQGYTLQTAVSLLDTTPTLAHIMGLKPHRDWEGQVVKEAFAS
jgi:predicted AlkP superfamily pyrophosphatase or phosphodiesterase